MDAPWSYVEMSADEFYGEYFEITGPPVEGVQHFDRKTLVVFGDEDDVRKLVEAVNASNA